MAAGRPPTKIERPVWPVARSTGVRRASWSATQAVAPSAVTATASARWPTGQREAGAEAGQVERDEVGAAGDPGGGGARWPRLVTARPVGPTPTGTEGRGARVARLMGVTVPEPRLATRAVAPSGEMASASGSEPTGMGGPAVMVVRSTGVTRRPFQVGHQGGPTGGAADGHGVGPGPHGDGAAGLEGGQVDRGDGVVVDVGHQGQAAVGGDGHGVGFHAGGDPGQEVVGGRVDDGQIVVALVGDEEETAVRGGGQGRREGTGPEGAVGAPGGQIEGGDGGAGLIVVAEIGHIGPGPPGRALVSLEARSAVVFPQPVRIIATAMIPIVVIFFTCRDIATLNS